MKKSISFFIFALLFGPSAFAALQTVTCVQQGGRAEKLEVHLEFSPSAELQPNWRNASLEPYSLGARNSSLEFTTSARMKVKLPSFIPNGGEIQWQTFFEVNFPNPAGHGYSGRFNGKGYRSFIGGNMNWDMGFYIPESVIGARVRNFYGLLTMKAAWDDAERTYRYNLTCDSRI